MDLDELGKLLQRMDGESYRAYKALAREAIRYAGFTARFTRIQGDPHAPPSVLEAIVPSGTHKLPSYLLSAYNRVPITDYIYRLLYSNLKSYSVKCGSGYSCFLGIPRPSPAMLPRSAVWIEENNIILRFYVGLPARGRRILGRTCYRLLYEKVPRALGFIHSLNDRVKEIVEHINLYHDHRYIREYLKARGSIAFIADGSSLPRESSISDKPLKTCIPYKSPRELRVVIKLPSGKTVQGSVIPRGVVVITGGGYHGKTTLLESLVEAVYPHIKGDGREYVVSLEKTVYVQAEDGRVVSCVDISSFIEKLPKGLSTKCFSSLDASGSTSMASSLSEAVELGVDAILIDEDTSATNLLYKDRVMASLIPEEPIKTLAEQARSFVEKTGAGLVVVSSASSAYLPVADLIVLMHNYTPKVVEKSKQIHGIEYYKLTEREFSPPARRVFRGIRDLLDLRAKGYKIVARYRGGRLFELDMKLNKRVVEKGQAVYAVYALKAVNRGMKGKTVSEISSLLDKMFEERGFSAFVDPVPPNLTWISGLDVVWALNRMYGAEFSKT